MSALTRCRLQLNNPCRGAGFMVGLAASLFAVWFQILLLATISLAPIGIDPVGNVPICHADDDGQPARHTPDQPRHECALCVTCLAHASLLAIVTSGIAFPDRPVIVVRKLTVVYARAPPVRSIAAAQPRAPPALI